ncbi:MAG: hypothetical protein IID33_00360 [Planctomycetes bacterium]|nr:hypothetical protein [Planctomycetota bacterium]
MSMDGSHTGIEGRAQRCFLAATLALLSGASAVGAGGGPENVAVVINADSWASLAIANEYIALRRIPAGNVVYLAGLRDIERIGINQFRSDILTPVLETLQQRGLAGQIDYVTYSCDIPYAIDVRRDAKQHKLPKIITPTASVTGVTFLYQAVRSRNAAYLSLSANRYFRRPIRTKGGSRRSSVPEKKRLPERMRGANLDVQATQGFRHTYLWDERGAIVETEGERYLLSTMLAVTSGRGNSVREALDCLRRAAAADGTHPLGTIYYLTNEDIRSKTRDPAYPSAVAMLRQLGVSAEILTGKLPSRKTDVQGLMTGTASFNWKASGSTILPGAICGHLTSFGGALRERAGQAPLTEFIRYGAAGASGTVAEPFAIQAKFPTAFVQVHYARGCSLAEAFYQSVAGPYQLLIVGDPLCQPWARIPRPAVSGLEAGATVRGRVTLEPSLRNAVPISVAYWDLFLDGRRIQRRKPGEALTLETESYADGYHELRVVAITDDAIETQGHLVLPLRISNHGRELKLTPLGDTKVPLDGTLRLSVELPGARRIEILHNRRSVARIEGERGDVEIEASRLGLGPVVLQALGILNDRANPQVVSAPLRFKIVSPRPLPALRLASAKKLAAGLELKLDGKHAAIVQDVYPHDWLTKAGARPGQRFELAGYFRVPEDDIYQFQSRSNADLAIHVDDALIAEPRDGRTVLIPIALRAGWHHLTVRGRVRVKPRANVRFGGPGARSLDGKRFKHIASTQP